MTEDIDKYKSDYDDGRYDVAPLRSLISRGSKAIRVAVQDPESGEWRNVVRMSRKKFDDNAMLIFLKEYGKWGRMGDAASAAGVTPQTVRHYMEEDEEFGEAVMLQENEYRDKLIGHHQNLLFNGTQKESYDRNGNLVSTETVYPIRLIELELKKHDKGYRDKQELEINHTGGVLVAPAETATIGDWEKRFGKAKDITPAVPVIEEADEV